jgi:glycosyltransferase involved in cell wall biosynthesis
VTTAGVGGGGALIVAGGAEQSRPEVVPEAIAAFGAAADALFLLVPVWPRGRRAVAAGARTLRRAEWWYEAATRSGLEPWVELRREAEGHACLALGPPRAQTVTSPAPRRRSSRPGLHIRIHDDLSRGTSFAWVSASIALALEADGVSVSIAPTEVTRSIAPARRRNLDALMERGRAPAATAEVGWTHFWPQYRRRLGGEHPLALFAVNYGFARADRAAWDPWMRALVDGDAALGPISSFCGDVLAAAGVGAERLDVVPLAATDGIAARDPAELAQARALKLLHVTNAADPLRHGTDVALAGFEQAFTPADDVTLVVRDYARANPEVARRVARLADAGYDARYWPVFFPEHRLATFLSAFDVLLAPFRGEGFGIKLLDAMACGVPVIAPHFGGPVDFLTEASGYQVPHRLAQVEAGYDAEGLGLGNGPLWAEIAPVDVARRLRDAHDDPDGRGSRGEAARRVAGGFSWERTARAIVASVQRRQHTA